MEDIDSYILGHARYEIFEIYHGRMPFKRSICFTYTLENALEIIDKFSAATSNPARLFSYKLHRPYVELLDHSNSDLRFKG